MLNQLAAYKVGVHRPDGALRSEHRSGAVRQKEMDEAVFQRRRHLCGLTHIENDDRTSGQTGVASIEAF
jgi:hypothetical protein